MQFRLEEWYSEAKSQVKAAAGGVTSYLAKGSGDREIHETLDYPIVSESLNNRIEKVEVVEEYGSKPHKPVRCELKLAKSGQMEQGTENAKQPTQCLLVRSSSISILAEKKK